MLPPWLRLLRCGPALVVFDDRTGRDFAVSGETVLASDPRLGIAGMLAPLSDALVPHRKVHPLYLPGEQALLCPAPEHHPAGGWTWRIHALDAAAARAWRAVDGRPSVAEVAGHAGLPLVECWAALASLTAWPVQAVQLRPSPLRPDHPALCRVVGPPRAPNERHDAMFDGAGTALGAFHDALDDADTRFDLAETTLAHAFGVPHPALSGERWGERLCDRLYKRLGEHLGPTRCVEVGGGTGELGAAFLDRAHARGQQLSYLRIDRSPALLAAQGARMPRTEGVVGDALALPVPAASVDLLVANEIIADLPSTRNAAGWDNTGALAFVGEVARVLAPGGVAFVSEFGSEADEPEETEQLDHPEVSIRFDRLVEAAQRLGVEAELLPIATFMGLDLDARWLWRPHLGAVRHLDQRAGRPLAAGRAWTPGALDAPGVEGLRWVTLRDEGPGPLPARTFALLLRRPASHRRVPAP